MTVSVKNLRYNTKEILKSVQRGEKPTITYRGKPIAQIVPIRPKELKRFSNIGFGMWTDHPAMENVTQWLNDQRKSRHVR